MDQDVLDSGVQKSGVALFQLFFLFFLVGYVEERPWWPIQSPNNGSRAKLRRNRHLQLIPLRKDLTLNDV